MFTHKRFVYPNKFSIAIRNFLHVFNSSSIVNSSFGPVILNVPALLFSAMLSPNLATSFISTICTGRFFFLELTRYLLLLHARSSMEVDLYNRTFLKEVLLLRVKHAPANTSLLLSHNTFSAP